jgi:D-arginine dehydrogenase
MSSPTRSDFDVVVIGAGLAGLSVAWWLRDRLRVCVVDQSRQVGAEASSQNAGMLRRLGEDPYERTLAIRVHELLSRPPTDALSDPGISRQTGAVLALGDDPYHLHDAASGLRARGVDIQDLDRATLRQVAPVMRDSPVCRAWFLPHERVVDAHLLLAALRHDLADSTTVRLDAQVSRILVEDGVVDGVVVDGVRVGAPQVVVAAGAWSRGLVAPLGLERPLIPLRRSLVQTRDPAGPPDSGHPWCWVDDVGVYVRPEGEGWLISGCDEAVDVPGPGPGSRGPLEELGRALALDKVARWFPSLGAVEPIAGWTGLRTFAPDRRPVLGEDPAVAGLHWCAGLGGFGVTCGLAAGEAVAAWLEGRSVPFLTDPLAVSAGRQFFSRWPIRPDGDLLRARLVRVARLQR